MCGQTSDMVSAAHQAYLDSVDVSKRDEVLRLHNLIMQIVPDWEQWVVKDIMAWGRYNYYGSSAKCSGEWFYIGLAHLKSGIGIYITPSDSDLTLPEQGKGKLGTSDIGKSCIRTKSVDKLNLEELERLLRCARQIIDDGGTGPGGKQS